MAQTINVNKLGLFIDGWADLVEGMGAKAETVRQEVLTQLESREMPDVKTANKNGYVDLSAPGYREYVVTTTFPGVTTVIYVAQHGKDLYTSWKTFIRPVINGALMVVLVIASFILGIFQAGAAPVFINSGMVFLIGWIGSLIFLCLLIAAAGYIFKRSVLAYFFVEPSYFDADDVTAMSLSVHYSILRALDKAGIESAKLRLKRDFTSGRKGDVV